MQTKSESLLQFINEHLNSNRTVVISTYLRSVQITPKTAKQFSDKGYKLFMIDSEGNLRMARGRKFDVICTPTTSLVTVKAY